MRRSRRKTIKGLRSPKRTGLGGTDMRTNKFFAILLAGMMILAMLSGTTVALAT